MPVAGPNVAFSDLLRGHQVCRLAGRYEEPCGADSITGFLSSSSLTGIGSTIPERRIDYIPFPNKLANSWRSRFVETKFCGVTGVWIHSGLSIAVLFHDLRAVNRLAAFGSRLCAWR